MDTCSRCGRFICGEDRVELHERTFCPECHARPEVNYLEDFRLKHWGKRDSWAWLAGVSASLTIAFVAMWLIDGEPITPGIGLASAVGLLLGFYFFGFRWARIALLVAIVLPPLVMVVSLIAAGLIESPGARAFVSDLGPVLFGYAFTMIVPLSATLLVFFDTRNRLFFKIPVSEDRLRGAWDLYANNTIARQGFLLSLLGVLIPGLSVPAAVCSGIGLSRVDPKALPPVGRRGQAIAGLVLSAIGIVGWSAVYAVTWFK